MRSTLLDKLKDTKTINDDVITILQNLNVSTDNYAGRKLYHVDYEGDLTFTELSHVINDRYEEVVSPLRKRWDDYIGLTTAKVHSGPKFLGVAATVVSHYMAESIALLISKPQLTAPEAEIFSKMIAFKESAREAMIRHYNESSNVVGDNCFFMTKPFFKNYDAALNQFSNWRQILDSANDSRILSTMQKNSSREQQSSPQLS